MTGSLRINVSGLQDKELDIPYIEDTSATKPKVDQCSGRAVLEGYTDWLLYCSTPAREWCYADFPRTVTARCYPVRSTSPA